MQLIIAIDEKYIHVSDQYNISSNLLTEDSLDTELCSATSPLAKPDFNERSEIGVGDTEIF